MAREHGFSVVKSGVLTGRRTGPLRAPLSQVVQDFLLPRYMDVVHLSQQCGKLLAHQFMTPFASAESAFGSDLPDSSRLTSRGEAMRTLRNLSFVILCTAILLATAPSIAAVDCPNPEVGATVCDSPETGYAGSMTLCQVDAAENCEELCNGCSAGWRGGYTGCDTAYHPVPSCWTSVGNCECTLEM